MKSERIKFDHVEGSRRLRQLRKERGLSFDTLANETGINKQSLKDYERAGESGDTQYKTRVDAFAGMSANNIVVLAGYFGVSTDYLLGLPVPQTPSTEVRAICEYTGLSEEAIKHLHHYAKEENPYPEYLEIMGEMLSNTAFYRSVACLVRAKRLKTEMNNARVANPGYDAAQSMIEGLSDYSIMSDKNSNSSNSKRVSDRELVSMKLWQAVKSFEKEAEYLVEGDY